MHKQGMPEEEGVVVAVEVDDADLPELDLLDIPELGGMGGSSTKMELERKASRKESMRRKRKMEEKVRLLTPSALSFPHFDFGHCPLQSPST